MSINDVKLSKLETLTASTGDVKDLEVNWLKSLITSLVTNGTFDTDTDWTKGTGWTIDAVTNFRADCDGTQVTDSLLTTTVAPVTVIGASYEVSFEVVAYTAGNVALQFEGIEVIADKAATGVYTAIVVATTVAGTIDIVADLDFVGSIDNVRLIPAIGHVNDLWHAYWDILAISSGHFNDRAFSWLGGLGHTGSLSDRWYSYWSA